MFAETDQQFMRHAIQLAKQAELQCEVPVGAVLVLDNEIISEGQNCPISSCDPSAHAEIVALRKAADKIQNYRLLNTTLYVTLEPCLMCVGAIIHARVKRVVFGAFDLKAGAVSSVFHMQDDVLLNHRVQYHGGLMAEECGSLLTEFFRARR